MVQDLRDVVVILTAIEIEYLAVRALLEGLHPISHPQGTEFEIGTPRGGSGRIAVAVVGKGNPQAAALTERAASLLHPRALIFTGIAGALHEDLDFGTVVVSEKVYSYHGGSETDDGFAARPDAPPVDHTLDQLAHVVSRGDWQPAGEPGDPVPQAHFRPIAAGEVLLNSMRSPLREQLRRNYADAGAIEMESAGSGKAAQLNRLPFITVRAISDRADGNLYGAAASRLQQRAARNAAAFAVALASVYLDRLAQRRSAQPDSGSDDAVAGISHASERGVRLTAALRPVNCGRDLRMEPATLDRIRYPDSIVHRCQYFCHEPNSAIEFALDRDYHWFECMAGVLDDAEETDQKGYFQVILDDRPCETIVASSYAPVRIRHDISGVRRLKLIASRSNYLASPLLSGLAVAVGASTRKAALAWANPTLFE